MLAPFFLPLTFADYSECNSGGEHAVAVAWITANVLVHSSGPLELGSSTGTHHIFTGELNMSKGPTEPRTRLSVLALGASILTSIFYAPMVSAQIEEVIVTAQRTEESLQEVPIAVTAITGEMLEDKGVITVSDLQMNAPNVSFTPTNFGDNSFSIRGIGRLVTAATGDAGVSIHTNQIAIGPNLNLAEFFDMERVEVLRGPQGTLYGKNATGGVVNFVTKMPNFDGVSGFVDAEAGDYSHTRFKGAFNVPVTDNFALRLAGMKLKRDGYTDNLAAGQVGLDGRVLPGIDDEFDGRDSYDVRITGLWEINDRASAWVMYAHSDEDSDRARITNQICTRSPIPTYGCQSDKAGFEQPNETSNFFNIGAMLFGVLPLGAPTLDVENGGAGYNWPRPKLDLREQHTDFEPEYTASQSAWLGSFSYEFDSFTAIIQGGYSEFSYISRQDYWMDVGANVAPSIYTDGSTLADPIPYFPISDALSPGALGDRGPCNVYDGNAGVHGPCVLRDDLTHAYSFDQADREGEAWTIEGRIQSSFEGRFNFILGVSAFDQKNYGDYYVNGNMGDARPDTYVGFFNNFQSSDFGIFGDGWAAFGETYFDITDRLKLTLGLRYNDDNKEDKSATVLWNATDINFGPCFEGLTDICSVRNEFFGGTAPEIFTRVPDFLTADPGFAVNFTEQDLLGLYSTEADVAAALLTPARSDERFAVANTVPVEQAINESRVISNSPDEFDWQEWSGRVLLNFQLNDNIMVYGGYSKGYKPGGANPAVPSQFQGESNFDFDQEDVDAWEIGAKTTLLDGRMVVNGALFFYDYEGLQVARIKNNTALNENIDSENLGAELEVFWSPGFMENLQLDFSYSYLDTDVQNTESVDPLDREGGNPDWLTFNQIGFIYAARREDITQEVVDVMNGAGAAFPVPNALYNDTITLGSDPANGVADGPIRPGSEAAGVPENTPIIMVRSVLDLFGLDVPGNPFAGFAPVDTVEGIPTDISGNNLPNSPENTIKLGAAYTWNLDAIRGALTVRWDYYWQDDSYAREFNTKADQIDSWDQHNAQLIYESANGRWLVRAFIRNIEDEDNVTGHYVTSDTSGYYRNYFLTEPRIYGASVRYAFGGG